MSSIDKIKSKIGKTKTSAPKIVLDLTLADAGDLEPDTTYLGRVVSARLLVREGQTPKIDLCIEVLSNAGDRIGVINENFYFSPRALRPFREFLLAADLPEDANNKELDPEELCTWLPGKHFGLITRYGVAPWTGERRIAIAQYIPIAEIDETEVA
jgi:hypothetical protein